MPILVGALCVFQDNSAVVVVKRSHSVNEGCKPHNSKGLMATTFSVMKSHMQQVIVVEEWCSYSKGGKPVSVFLDATFGYGSGVLSNKLLSLLGKPLLLAHQIRLFPAHHSLPVITGR
jgi:hypothetical protein